MYWLMIVLEHYAMDVIRDERSRTGDTGRKREQYKGQVTNETKDSEEDQPRPAISLSRMWTKGRPSGRNVAIDLMNLRAEEVLQWAIMV
jgi:hypothetical protein